jgi:hypothetical protein
VASCAAARLVAVVDVARKPAAAVSASSDSSGLDVEVAGVRAGMRRVVVGDIARRIPCRIEEGREEGAAASQR